MASLHSSSYPRTRPSPREKGHRNRQCHYKKFEETIKVHRRNQFSSRTVYVHIRICHCHFDEENAPDRSQYIFEDHPVDGTTEGNGIEFHLQPRCKWINVGSEDKPTLKRVCVVGCKRYPSIPENEIPRWFYEGTHLCINVVI